jgi:predicted RNA-binding Zn-ribbon protein involved in translation (DUF1610 family)
MKLVFKRRSASCPVCGRNGARRTERARKWKALPMGRSYACPHCNSYYIHVAGRFALVTELGFGSFSPAEKTN